MKPRRIIWIAGVSLGLVCIAVVAGQFLNGSELLRQLESENWQERAIAVQKLAADSDALRSGEVKSTLLNLLERENQLIESTLRQSNGMTGVSATYGEGYSEYYSTLLGVVDKTADFANGRTLGILVRSAYNPDSPFGLKIASYGEPVIAPLLELVNSDLSTDRGKALAVLSETISQMKLRGGQLPSQTQDQIMQVFAVGTRDAEPYVRTAAVRALGKVGDKNVIPLLERIAQTDPAALPTLSRVKKGSQ